MKIGKQFFQFKKIKIRRHKTLPFPFQASIGIFLGELFKIEKII
jgi:hypothetical protein